MLLVGWQEGHQACKKLSGDEVLPCLCSDVNKATHVKAKATTPKAKAMAFKAKAAAANAKAKAGNLWPQAKAKAKA